jgi:hypothetical protein
MSVDMMIFYCSDSISLAFLQCNKPALANKRKASLRRKPASQPLANNGGAIWQCRRNVANVGGRIWRLAFFNGGYLQRLAHQ